METQNNNEMVDENIPEFEGSLLADNYESSESDFISEAVKLWSW